MVAVIALFLASTAILIIVVLRWKKKSEQKPEHPESGPENQDPLGPEKDVPVAMVESDQKQNPSQVEAPLPTHIVLNKEDNLKEKLKDLANQPEVLTKEYNVLKQYVQEHIKKEVTVARLPENKTHNRYTDNGERNSFLYVSSCLVPFDDNYITLNPELFPAPETCYVNASKITFNDFEQTFIACQAPKPLSFKHFWHMVIQEQVKMRQCLLPKTLKHNSGHCDRHGDSSGGEEEAKGAPVLAGGVGSRRQPS